MIFEPKWKSLLANTTGPIFSPAQCQDIINMGHQQKAEEAKVGHKDGLKGGKHDAKMRVTTISWIPFKALPDMYKIIERSMLQVNGNHYSLIPQPQSLVLHSVRTLLIWVISKNKKRLR